MSINQKISLSVFSAAILSFTGTLAGAEPVSCHEDRLLGFYPATDEIGEVLIHNGYIFAADGGFGLRVYDANAIGTDAVATLEMSGVAISLERNGNALFVGTSNQGVRRIDISDPLNPVFADRVSVGGYCYDIETVGDVTFARVNSSGTDDFKILQTPQAGPMSVLGSMNTSPESILWRDDLLVLGSRYATAQLYDVVDPTNPVYIGGIPGLPAGDYGNIHMDLQDDLLVLAHSTYNGSGDQRMIVFVDVSDPAVPQIISSVDIGYDNYFGTGVGELQIEDDRLYANLKTDNVEYIAVYDISDLSNVNQIGAAFVPGTRRNSVLVENQKIYVSQDFRGVAVYDATDPTGLPLEFSSPPAFSRDGISGVAGDQTLGIYIDRDQSDAGVLSAFDLESEMPTDPVGSVDLEGMLGYAYEIIDIGDFAVVGGFQPALTVIDLSDPTSPAILAQEDAPDRAEEIFAVGSLVFARRNGTVGYFDVFDLSDPSAPTLLGRTGLPAGPVGAAIETVAGLGDQHLVVCSRLDGINIVDVSSPLNPTVIGEYDLHGWGIVVRGDIAYIHSVPNIVALDLSDPANPALLDSLEIMDRRFPAAAGDDLELVGDNLFIAIELDALRSIDVSDPTNLVMGNIYPIDYQDEDGITAAGDRLILDTRFTLFDLGECGDCPADLTGDGVLDFFDVSAFLSAYNAQDPAADFTGDGQFDFFDVSAFLGAYSAGCP
ncbi:MAG: GC-type dockerin domain-anchored protein [Phycisphaerales bacterium]